MFPKGYNIKWIQLQSKHEICLILGALRKCFQFISMKKSIANWNYLFIRTKQGLIQQSTSTSSQSYSHSKDRFFKKKKKKGERERERWKEKRELSKSLGTRGIGLVLLSLLSKPKKKKNHQSRFSIISKVPGKIFIKFFFMNRKLWSSSIFSSGATSSQLSTLSILRSMEYVPN